MTTSTTYELFWLGTQIGDSDPDGQWQIREATICLVTDVYSLLNDVADTLHANSLQFRVLTDEPNRQVPISRIRRHLGKLFSWWSKDEAWSAYETSIVLKQLHDHFQWDRDDKAAERRWLGVAVSHQVMFYDPEFGGESVLLDVLAKAGLNNHFISGR